jgi:hypothetical protein
MSCHEWHNTEEDKYIDAQLEIKEDINEHAIRFF